MAFEATKNFKKKSAGGRFEATSNFGVDDTVISSRVNAISKDIESLYNDYYKDYTERSKYVLGVDSKYENMQAPGLKVSMQSYKDRAKKIKQSIEDNKAFLTPEGYLAALQKVNSIIDTDTTEDDKTFSDYFNSSAAAGGRDKFNKIVEERAAAQSTLKKAGLSENSKYRDIEAALSDRTIDAGAAPDEMGQGRRYQGRKLTSEEKDYLSSLLLTEDKVSTMTDDEILRKIKDKGSPSYKQKIAMEEIDRLTKKNEELIKLAEADGNVSSFNPYGDYAEEYADNQQRMEKLRNMIDSDYAGRDVAYYYTDDNGINAMSWENLYYERKVGNAYKAATDKGYGGYNSAAAAAYDEINFIEKVTEAMQWLEQNSTVSAEKKKPYLDIVKEYDEKYGTNYAEEDGIYSIETKNWINSEIKNSDALNKLKENFKSESGATYDAVKDYAKLQRDKKRAAKVQETVQTAVEGVNSVPVVGKALGGIASAISAVPFALVSGTDYIFNLMDSIGHSDYNSDSFRPINTYDDYATNISGEIIGAQTEIYDKAMQEAGVSETARKIWTSTYSGVSSGINSLATVVGSCYAFGPAAGQVVASVILSGQAASSGLQEAVQNGSTTNEALAYGFASGVAEYLGEKISIGSLVDKFLESSFDVTSFKSFMKSFVKDKNLLKMLGQGAVEGSEEVVTEIMNRFSDAVINQDHSKFSNAILTYEAEGLSREEAKKKAFLDVLASAAEQAWGGFVGGIMGGTAAVIGGGVSAARNSVADIKNQTDIGKSIAGTDAGKNVLEIAEKRGFDISKASEEVPEGRGVGKLVSKVRNAVRNRNMGKLAQNVVEAELKAAKETAMPIVNNNESLAEMVAEIATGTADVSAISALSANGVLTEENVEKVFEALEAVQKRTETSEVRNMINDIVETKESSEGKAYNASSIYGIKREGGKTKYILEDGTEVDSGEFGLTSKDKTLFVNAVKGMTDAEANEMISAYRKYANGTDKGVFATTWGLYRSLGETGAAKNGERVAGYKSRIYFTQNAEVNNVLVTSAIEQGVKARAQSEMKRNIKARAERVIQERGRAKGEVRGEEHLGKNKSGVKNVARTLAKLGYDVEFLSEDAKLHGKRIGDTLINGAYDEKTNTIYLRADATYNATDVRGILGHTLAHEVTHSIKTWSEADYNVLTDYIRDALEADFDALVKEKMDKLGMSYAMASDEVIADGCEMLLRDSKALEKLATENASLFVKVVTKVREFIANLRKAQTDMYDGNEELHDAALKLREALKSLEEVQEVFDNALENSIRNMRDALAEAENAKTRENLDVLEKQAEKEGVQLSEEEQNDGNTEKISEETKGKIKFDAKTDSASPAFSEETWRESDYVQHRNEAAKALSTALGVSKAKALKYIDDVNSIAKTIADDRVRLDYRASSFGSAFVSNAEYGGSFDYTTLCKKRRIYTGTFSEIQKRLRNTALTADEILDLRNMLIAAGYEATCGLCYVEGSRAQMGKFAKEFINLYKRDNPNAWIPDMADVNTPDGVEQMRINHPEAYESYEYFWNHYGKLKDSDKALFASQQKPKLYESRKAYRNEIKKLFKSDSSIERKNLNGGIRMQSFSDFEIVHLIDTMQVIMDMSEVGLTGQAYTKVPEFAKAFGNTGLKINLSLIAKGVDENGRLIFDDREGMPHDTAFELRDQYSENVGTILVTFTDEQAFAAMADDRIDFIIPFHRSQWKKGQYNAMGLPKGTKDYTYVQNEKLIKKTYHEYRGRQVLDKATNYMPNEYWDFSKSGRENAEAYLDMCAKNNKRPKFYKFLDYDGNGRYSLKTDGSTDGYWKLLIDFKMYDNDGNGSPQKAVRPDFNMEESRKMLDEYTGGHQSYPVANDVVDKFVDKYKSEHEGMQFSQESIKVQAKVTAKYQSEVDKILKMQNTNPTNLIIGYTPSLYRELGMPSIPFVIGSGHVYSAAKTEIEAKQDGNYRKGIHYHGLGDTLVKNIYSKLQDPVMIIAAKDVNKKARTLRSTHSVVAIVDVGQAGESLLLPVEITAERTVNGEQMDVNVLSSAYTKNVAKLIKEAISLENIGDVGIYYAKKEATNLIPAGVQFPIRIQEAIASGSIIRSFDQKVNRNISKNTESSQFKRWFGDWQNNPARASKAVNRDGTPKVLYHYTDNVFSIFDISRSGANQGKTHGDGIYLSSNPNEFSYAGKNRMQLYAAIFHPFEMQLSKAEAEKIYDKYFKPFHKDTYNTYKPHVIEKLQSPTRVFDYLNEAAEKNNIKTSDILGELGYDGVHDGPEWVAFKETQVKSATDNIGTFDGANGDIYFSEETETSRDTLVSDMEAVAETDEEKSFVEKLKSEVKKANALQKELDEVNRKIKEISFTKGADRSALPSLNEEKERIAKKLNRLDSKFYGYRGYDTFKTLAERKSKEAVIAERLRGKEALRSQKQKYQEAAQGIKDTLAQREENRRRREIVRDIAKRIDKLDKLAKEDSKTKHIPSALRDIVKAFREQIDSRTQNYDERIARAENAIASLEKRRGKYLDAYTEYTQLAERIKQYDKGSKDYADADARMGQLKQDFDSYNSLTEQIEKKLSSIEKSGERNVRAADYLSEMLSYYKTYDNADSTYYIDVSDLARAIEDLRHSIGERPLYLLTADQLEDVLAVTKAVQKKISDANKLFRSSRSVSETTAKVAGETKDARNKKVSRSDFVRGAKDRTVNMLYWNNLKPYELFKQSGSDTLYQLYRNLQRAEGDSGRLILKYADKYRETAQKYGIKEKMFNQKFDITFDNGKTARLTGGEILTLYLTAKRGQGRVHLLGDGFRLEGGKMRLVADGKETVYANADMMTLTENDLTKFGKTLSDDMRRFGDEMQKYMSTEIAADGNAVSMKLYDIMLFGEDNYITLTVDNNYLRSTIDPKKNTAKLKNSKFTIKTVANATQALSISSFVNVYQTHASDMAAYAAFTLPLEDITKVINGTSKSEDGSTRVRDVLGSKLYGEMMKFLTDVNGGIRSDGDLAYMRLFSAVKAARTGLNLAVAIQQPCAVMRAFAEINPKYFIGVKAKTMSEAQQRKSLAEMTQYASTWVVKQLGGVDINTKQSIGKTITDLGAKGNTLGHTAAKGLQEGQFWVAEKLDQVTWMWIWNACRNEAIDNFKKSNADYTYKDVLKKAGDRFDEITNKTQVYDSIFARSKIMRDGKAFEKFITQFMAEPMTTLNMAYDGVRLLLNGEKGKAAGIFASLIASQIFTAAIRSFADAFRDDDDDKNYWEKYLQALIENSIDNINPFMLLPWFKDIYSLVFNGFNVDRPDVEIIGDLMTKVKKLAKVWGDESKNAKERAEASWDALSILADMSGVAMTSLTRDFRAIYRTIATEWQSATKTTTNTAADTAWKNGLSRNLTTPRDDKGKLYYAFMNDDDTYIARTQDRLGEKDFRRRVIDCLKDNDIRIAEAAAAHMDGDYEKYDSIIRDIANDGFDKEYVVAAVVSAENKALKDSADEDEDVDTVSQIDGMTATKKDIIADVEEGNYDLLEEYYRLKVDYYKEKEADDPEGKAFTSVRSLLSGHYRDLYKDGDEDERERIADILGDVTVDGHKVIKKSTVRKWKED
jgi:hypothetical protein